ncbi:MAG: zinc finger domain-containing protein [Acidimicrobiales bacterium]
MLLGAACPPDQARPFTGNRSGHLGPDLTSPDPDLEQAVRRFAEVGRGEVPIAVAVLDQRICCGVGNVYKSEVLHALGICPDRRLDDVSIDDRRAIVTLAHQLLRANLGSGPRTTVEGGLAVYGKRGEPCPRCSSPIERAVHGEHARSTYYCPVCQCGSESATSPARSTGRH